MRATKKEEQLILDIYRRIYSEIGVDLDELIDVSKNTPCTWLFRAGRNWKNKTNN